MARVSIKTQDKLSETALPPGFGGSVRAQGFFTGAKDPIHMLQHHLGTGNALIIGPLPADCLAYVWKGAASAGGHGLAAGSSLIVESGAALEVTGCAEGTLLLTFAADHRTHPELAGGHIHILPAERVPRTDDLSGSPGLKGAMHANAACPTCAVWLHENDFAPAAPLTPEQAARGIHSHSEDEVIFITKGAIRLGRKLFPEGTAVAIAADTLYAIAPGPDGMAFINFRAGRPGDIQFANGTTMSETGYWLERVAPPVYL